jgi:hypothetical protein
MSCHHDSTLPSTLLASLATIPDLRSLPPTRIVCEVDVMSGSIY